MLRHLSLNLENRLVDVACTDARLVSILRCEERKFAWLASNVGKLADARFLRDGAIAQFLHLAAEHLV